MRPRSLLTHEHTPPQFTGFTRTKKSCLILSHAPRSLLVQLIHERTEAFRGALLQGGGTVAANQATVALEQLYWLISIAGRCVADDGEGEIPMVPHALKLLVYAALSY